MKYNDGTEMKVGDVGYSQPPYLSGGTPLALVFIRTVNGCDDDPAGLFDHKHMIDDPPPGRVPSFCVHWTGTLAKTPEEALRLRAKALRKLADRMEALA